jgi:hypothetical protein
MTGPFPVAGGPRLRCVVVAEQVDLAAWALGLASAGWEVASAVAATDLTALDSALARRRVHALVVATPSAPGAKWPASAMGYGVDRALHAMVPWEALPASGGVALARKAARDGAVVLVHGQPVASTAAVDERRTTEVARALGDILRRCVTGDLAAETGPMVGDALPVRRLAEAVG